MLVTLGICSKVVKVLTDFLCNFVSDVCREMVECFHQISDDSECRAVVLTGAGKLFTAGWNTADFEFNVTNMLISPCILYKISSS